MITTSCLGWLKGWTSLRQSAQKWVEIQCTQVSFLWGWASAEKEAGMRWFFLTVTWTPLSLLLRATLSPHLSWGIGWKPPDVWKSWHLKVRGQESSPGFQILFIYLFIMKKMAWEIKINFFFKKKKYPRSRWHFWTGIIQREEDKDNSMKPQTWPWDIVDSLSGSRLHF